jgi:hypothetical protein
MAFALSVRGFDFTTQYTYAYSKQVGLQTNGPWELKKDYVELEAGRQVYSIPAGREVNEVLWITPPATSQALLAIMVELILVLVVVWHKLVVEWELVVVVKEVVLYRTSSLISYLLLLI